MLIQGSPSNSTFTWINRTSVGTTKSLPSLFRSDQTVQSETNSPLLHTLQSVMTERQCMHIVVQDPSLVICASHECLGLFLRADIESLVIDWFEAAFDHCISLLLCLKDTFVQFDVLHTHPLTILHHIARNSLRCIVHHMLLIKQAADWTFSGIGVPCGHFLR